MPYKNIWKNGNIGKETKIFYICIAFCLLIGVLFIFAMKGHDYIGYLVCGISILVLIYRFLILHKMKKLRNGLTICILIGIVIFTAAEIQVIKDAKTDKDVETDYVIVLGSSVRGTKPSVSLVNRLDKAYEYLKENPDSYAIVSGGQGAGEDITEAEAMRIWLEEKGIDKNRIIKEEKSTSTEENLKYSFAIMEERGRNPKDGAAIISSEYHLHRAKKLAEKQGARPYGIAASTSLPLVKVNYFIREALGVVYMWVLM